MSIPSLCAKLFAADSAFFFANIREESLPATLEALSQDPNFPETIAKALLRHLGNHDTIRKILRASDSYARKLVFVNFIKRSTHEEQARLAAGLDIFRKEFFEIWLSIPGGDIFSFLDSLRGYLNANFVLFLYQKPVLEAIKHTPERLSDASAIAAFGNLGREYKIPILKSRRIEDQCRMIAALPESAPLIDYIPTLSADDFSLVFRYLSNRKSHHLLALLRACTDEQLSIVYRLPKIQLPIPHESAHLFASMPDERKKKLSSLVTPCETNAIPPYIFLILDIAADKYAEQAHTLSKEQILFLARHAKIEILLAIAPEVERRKEDLVREFYQTLRLNGALDTYADAFQKRVKRLYGIALTVLKAYTNHNRFIGDMKCAGLHTGKKLRPFIVCANLLDQFIPSFDRKSITDYTDLCHDLDRRKAPPLDVERRIKEIENHKYNEQELCDYLSKLAREYPDYFDGIVATCLTRISPLRILTKSLPQGRLEVIFETLFQLTQDSETLARIAELLSDEDTLAFFESYAAHFPNNLSDILPHLTAIDFELFISIPACRDKVIRKWAAHSPSAKHRLLVALNKQAKKEGYKPVYSVLADVISEPEELKEILPELTLNAFRLFYKRYSYDHSSLLRTLIAYSSDEQFSLIEDYSEITGYRLQLDPRKNIDDMSAFLHRNLTKSRREQLYRAKVFEEKKSAKEIIESLVEKTFLTYQDEWKLHKIPAPLLIACFIPLQTLIKLSPHLSHQQIEYIALYGRKESAINIFHAAKYTPYFRNTFIDTLIHNRQHNKIADILKQLDSENRRVIFKNMIHNSSLDFSLADLAAAVKSLPEYQSEFLIVLISLYYEIFKPDLMKTLLPHFSKEAFMAGLEEATLTSSPQVFALLEHCTDEQLSGIPFHRKIELYARDQYDPAYLRLPPERQAKFELKQRESRYT